MNKVHPAEKPFWVNPKGKILNVILLITYVVLSILVVKDEPFFKFATGIIVGLLIIELLVVIKYRRGYIKYDEEKIVKPGLFKSEIVDVEQVTHIKKVKGDWEFHMNELTILDLSPKKADQKDWQKFEENLKELEVPLT